MHVRFAVAALAASMFAGCSGGGSGPVTPGSGAGTGANPGTGSGSSTQAIAVSAISDTNALGTPLDNFAEFDKTAGSASGGLQTAARTRDAATGTCRNGVEFFAPDKNGDADSTESIAFYDTACANEARDTVRTFSSTGTTSETVNVTEMQFASGNATPIATRTATHTLSGATFNQYGYPVAADGYSLVASDALAINTAKTIDSAREFVLEPATSGTNAFCSDSAGYNATGVAATGDTFGWAGSVASGSRTVNADGSVTWTATHSGTGYTATTGGLSILTASPNTACPIATPDFTLGGGTSTGTYTIPLTATYLHGMLETLAISNATLANGDTLNVTTNAGQPPSSSQFVTGSIASGSTQIATFAVDAFGDGILTVTATGKQFVVTDWHVVK